MKRIFPILLIGFLFGIGYSQTDTTIYDMTDPNVTKPRWPGCDTIANENTVQNCWDEHWHKFLNENLEYPQHCHECFGKVWFEFTIGFDGSLMHAKILKGVGQPLDDEVLRVIMHLPIFVPAKKNGLAVKFRYRIPIIFEIR